MNKNNLQYIAENQIVSYDKAVYLKSLGFNRPCFANYYISNVSGRFVREVTKNLVNWNDHSGKFSIRKSSKKVSAPFWQDVLDWLREEHNFTVEWYLLNKTKPEKGYEINITHPDVNDLDSTTLVSTKYLGDKSFELSRGLAIREALILLYEYKRNEVFKYGKA